MPQGLTLFIQNRKLEHNKTIHGTRIYNKSLTTRKDDVDIFYTAWKREEGRKFLWLFFPNENIGTFYWKFLRYFRVCRVGINCWMNIWKFNQTSESMSSGALVAIWNGRKSKLVRLYLWIPDRQASMFLSSWLGYCLGRRFDATRGLSSEERTELLLSEMKINEINLTMFIIITDHDGKNNQFKIK